MFDIAETFREIHAQLYKLEEQLTSSGVRLFVPWVSQLGLSAKFAPGDCGPAALTMVLRYLYPDRTIEVDEVSRKIGRPKGFKFTNNRELYTVAAQYDVMMYWARHLDLTRLHDELVAGRPVLALVHYPSLLKKRDPDYPWSHFVTVVGFDENALFYHDPYWNDADNGAFIEIPNDAFITAWTNVTENENSARQCLRIKP